MVITRFKVKTQFKLDLTGTGTELSYDKHHLSRLRKLEIGYLSWLRKLKKCYMSWLRKDRIGQDRLAQDRSGLVC